MKTILTDYLVSLRAIVVFTVLTGLAYPLAMTGVAQALFPHAANGSLVGPATQPAGSALLAQKFTAPKYFWPRPSASDYGTVPSGASNQGFTSAKLAAGVEERRAAIGPNAPSDLLYASGSGLDPHISPEAAEYQVARVAAARQLPPEAIRRVVATATEGPQFGFLGQSRVNVLVLNRALDALR
ncbi:K+-transporting ATPase ATPase C chain [Terrimicrobium sacchariphilum]|uniref:Potassium-transporting ATPase KdpC subunit n=1 Tax=Terrimicrobium sacchariphilum TaxID=690879 RepID=A0A146GF69_TERSA|nr:potassium-transporting ATPase subunit KdpC [Terrimicrobium sacchariphilum]GAT35116.1 K+-transporting ATPase ATPase C chain [Terrimicrobium sacchariphilum]